MKALLLTHHWPPYTHHSKYSGYERIVHYLEDLHEIDVLTWKSINFNYNDPPNVYRAFTPPTDFLLERRLLLSLNALSRSKNYDLIHALYSVPGLFPSFRYVTIATIHLVHDLDRENIWLRYKTLIQRVLFRNVKCLITVSSNLKNILENTYHLENVIYIPHGIDTKFFTPAPNIPPIKKRILAEGFDFVSLTTGVNGTDKEFIFQIAEKYPSVLFCILGKRISPHPLNVRFFSGLSDECLKSLYDCADIFIKPLNFASANNSLLEAMSMCKPIITDAISGVTDYLDDNTAFLVREREDFVQTIEEVLDNRNARDFKAINARKRAKNEFDWKVIAKKTSEVYEMVVK